MSSGGQAIGGIVGGIIGFMVGGPVGALRGAQIGIMAGGLIDPPKGPTINGPRLEDLNVQTSTYGAFIPRNYGTVAQSGNVFWIQGDAITEVQTTTTSGGKGGPEQTTNTWSYYATFAVGLCKGPIDGVRRIWIGGQLWYDAGSDDLSTIIASNQKTGLFTLYLGTDTQTADPLIQADKGAANVPAYRGLAYIVFDALPLEKYGNSLMGAQVKVEVVKNGVVTSPITLVSTESTGAYPHSIAVTEKYAYVTNVGANTFQTYDITSPTDPVLLTTVSTGGTPETIKVVGGYAYICNTGSNTLQIYVLNEPSAPVLVGSVATGGRLSDISVDESGLYAYGSNIDLVRVQEFLLSDKTNPSLVGYAAASGSPFGVFVAGNYAYVSCMTTGNLHIYNISSGLVEVGVYSSGGGEISSAYVEGNYAYLANYGTGDFNVVDVSTPSAPTLSASVVIGGAPYKVLVDGEYAYLTTFGGALRAIDISVPTSPVLAGSAAVGGDCLSISVYNGLLYAVKNATTLQLQTYIFAPNSIAGSGVQLSSIVESECLTSNLLTSGDLDVTELTDEVRGYRVSQIGAIRGAIDPLRAAWPFDVVQHGYQILFKRRGSASVATIQSTLLDARAAGESPGVQITDSREMDLMLPRRVDIQYLDSVREYDINEQMSPERTSTDAVGIRKLDLPIVFTGAEAAQTAETLLYLYWLERYDVVLRLPPEYSELEPGDVITVTSDTADYELRLTSINTLPDGRMECAAKYNKAAIYAPVARGEEGQSTGGTLTLDGPSVYSLLDIPLLRDDDDTAGFPVAMTGYLSGWPGGILYRSDDGGQSWTDLRAFSPGTVMGYATTTLAAHGGTVIDFSSTLTVRLYSGTLASVTQAQMFAGQNWFAYGSDGRWEIIAAATAVLQGDGTYILTDFLRGQRGTEWATGLHAANDRIVLLDANSLAFISVNSSTIGTARDYRGITTGRALSSDTSLSFSYDGVNLECLSPVHMTGNRHPSTNDWTLTWTRRSRYDQWRDYVDAPLGETSESYEIDVYSSGTYATVVRTITASSATAAYTSAQQVTDFGSNQATLYLKVYQLSATVGRGYPLTQSITR